jgi:diguanylate cyclase (GGDEF)-like protein
MNSIQNKLTLIFIVGLLITTSLTGFIIVKYERLTGSMILLSNKVNDIQDSTFNTHVYFKTQIQEWKNILLRGYDKKFYNKYYRSFLFYEKKTIQEVKRLQIISEGYPELRDTVEIFSTEYKKLSVLYREGLSIYSTTKYEPQIAADNHVRGIDREPVKLLDRIVKISKNLYKIKERNVKESLHKLKITVTFIYIVTIFLLIAFFWFAIKKGVSQPFNDEMQRKNQLAMTDALTGIANRHAYNKRISYEIERYQHDKKIFIFLLFDIDEFKSVNDSFGHEAGDKVIIETATIINNNIRKKDFMARYGGEEFVLLLPDTDINTAEKIANKLRKIVECHKFYFNDEQVNITVSVGLAEIKINDTKKELFERVDTALYGAKNAGRNKCVVAVN